MSVMTSAHIWEGVTDRIHQTNLQQGILKCRFRFPIKLKESVACVVV